MCSYEWIGNLNVGDQVIVDSRSERFGRLAVVERVTPTQVVVQGRRYRKDDGFGYGDTSGSLSQATQAAVERIHRRNKANELIEMASKRSQWDSAPLIMELPLGHLEALIAVMENLNRYKDGKLIQPESSDIACMVEQEAMEVANG